MDKGAQRADTIKIKMATQVGWIASQQIVCVQKVEDLPGYPPSLTEDRGRLQRSTEGQAAMLLFSRAWSRVCHLKH